MHVAYINLNQALAVDCGRNISHFIQKDARESWTEQLLKRSYGEETWFQTCDRLPSCNFFFSVATSYMQKNNQKDMSTE